MKNFQAFISAVLAGIIIALGGAASLILSIDSPFVSALFFSAGLLAVAVFELSIFTDNLGAMFLKHRTSKQATKTFIVWLGNTIGALLVGIAMTPKANANALAKHVVGGKFDISFANLCVGSILCGVLIYIAMHGFRKSGNGFTGCAVLVAAATVIDICGFEYALTNTFLIGAAFDKFKNYSSNIGEVFMLTIFVALGNILGALFFSALNKLKSDDVKFKRHHHKHRHHHSHSESDSEKQS